MRDLFWDAVCWFLILLIMGLVFAVSSFRWSCG